jgi:hypothetical protein
VEITSSFIDVFGKGVVLRGVLSGVPETCSGARTGGVGSVGGGLYSVSVKRVFSGLEAVVGIPETLAACRSSMLSSL